MVIYHNRLIRTDVLESTGRILASPSVEINYVQDSLNHYYLTTRIGDGAPYLTSGGGESVYGSVDKWRFIAITYDGTKTSDQLSYYTGAKAEDVQFVSNIDAPQGQLLRAGNGGNIWIGNRMSYNGDNPFIGQIDELRIWSSKTEDSNGVLDIDELEAVRQTDITPVALSPIVETARIYLPFEGEADNYEDSVAWRNRGVTSYGEGADQLGMVSAEFPTVTANGLKDQAYDGSGLIPMTQMSTYAWGGFGQDTMIEDAIKNCWSFTLTGWIKTDSLLAQGRIFSSPPVEINYIASATGARIAPRIEGSVFNNASYDTAKWGCVGQWRFVAITYDGTKSVNNLHVFYGSQTESVMYDMSFDTDWGILDDVGYGGNFYLGNSNQNANRPFVGYLDELRIFSTNAQNSDGALSIDQIEAVRQADLGISKCVGGFMAGDLNYDCKVDMDDMLYLTEDWLKSNPVK